MNIVDLQAVGQWALVAAALLALASPATAALMQLIKQAYGAVTRGLTIRAQWQAIIPGLLNCALIAWALVSQGAPLAVAVLAALIALYTPKLSYDVAKGAHMTAAGER